MGLNGIAITDHESLSGHIKALKYYNQKTKENEEWKNFKLILGNEIYLCRNGLSLETYEKGERYPHFILLAKDAVGHAQLRELSTRAWSHSFTMFMTRVPTYYSDIEEIIGNNPGHIIASSACIGGLLGICKNNHAEQNAVGFLKWCKKLFGEDFYLELQPARYEEQIEYNKWLLELGKSNDIKCIITTDSHYLKKEDRDIHSAFLNSKDGDRETADFYQYTYLMSQEEIIELTSDYISLDDLQILFSNTNEINDKIETYDLEKVQKVPFIQDDRNTVQWEKWLKSITIQDKYIYLNNFLTSDFEDDRFFLYLCLNKIEELKLSPEKRNNYIQRLETELTEMWLVSKKLGQSLSSYMLMSRTLVDFMWNECDSIVGVSRGSVGCMLSAYLCGIIDMNTMKSGYNMDPRRFCYRDKIELSDIDLDSEGSKRNIILKKLDEKMKKQNGRCIGIATFGTLGSRSTILTLCRGMGIDNDEAQYMASLIGQERGFSYSLTDCLFGNEEKERKPVKPLIQAFSKYPGLKEGCLALEGLVCQMGIHASGVCVYNNDLCEYSCSMKAPNGAEITQWDLHDSEYAGSLKVDMLSIEAADKLHNCINLLMKDNLIEWQGTLRKTYLKYIHPDVLEYNAKEMWELINKSKIIDLFQMDTQVAKDALKRIKPESVGELSQLNSLMRLMPEKGEITPIEEYLIYKSNPALLKKEIYDLEGELCKKDALYNFLKQYNGVPSSQESVMYLTMEPEICNWTFSQANTVKKIIGKKLMSKIPWLQSEIFKDGLANGCSNDIMEYVWKQLKRTLGYAFNEAHTYGYSLIALQEMNLNLKYPPIYWATACLTVNSGAEDTVEEKVSIYEKEDPNNEYEDLPDRSGKIKRTTNYGKLSSALGRIKKEGINVELPDINKALFSFVPDIESNSILYGLKGISDVGDEIINNIIINRPYKNFDDFMEKIKPGKSQTISLIKSGCFDNLEKDLSRKELMLKYLSQINPPKSRITLQNMNGLINNNLIPKNKMGFVKLYNFCKYIKAFAKDDKLYLDDRAYKYFSDNFDISVLSQDKQGTYINKAIWEKLYSNKMNGIRDYFSNNQEKLINALQEAEISSIWNDSCNGTLSSWEMESLGFYYHEHELTNCTHLEFDFVDFFELPEIAIPYKYIKYKDRDIPVFELVSICGTVLDKNSYKHTITLLTPSGVVSVKCVGEQYSEYDKQISKLNKETGKKEVIEKSWFKRGTKLIVNGYRSGDQFMARSRQSESKHAFYKVLDIGELGQLEITRYRAEE